MYAGEQAMAANQWKTAVDHYDTVVKGAPGNAVAMNNLAWSLYELRDPRALPVAEEAYARAPQSAAVIDTLGLVLLEKGDTKRATELLKQAAALAPKAADIRWHYVQALVKTGDKAAAKTEAQAVERDFPDTAQAKQARELGAKL
jgi:tetratricopeptide (TPR) repeat protein